MSSAKWVRTYVELNKDVIIKFIASVISVVDEVENLAKMLSNYQKLLSTNVFDVNVKTPDIVNVDVNVSRIYKRLEVLPKPVCIDTDVQISKVVLHCNGFGCEINLTDNSGSVSRSYELRPLTIYKLLEMVCNITEDDLNHIVKGLNKIRQDIAETIEMVKAIITAIKIITSGSK
jgi:predicted sugar kinase